jgi:hypothetical protein
MPRSLVLLASLLVACSAASSPATRPGPSAADDFLRSDSARIRGEGSDFADIEDVRGDLSTILAFLKREGFADYWAATALPRIREFVARNAAELGRYDVVGADERVLGRHLEVEELTVFALAYVKPHGIRVTGWRFLTDVSYPLEVTVRTALHELLHPPFLPGSPGERALQGLSKDPFLQRLVREHDPRFGYTTTAGLLEEDADTAIHIFNSVHLGVRSLRAMSRKACAARSCRT